MWIRSRMRIRSCFLSNEFLFRCVYLTPLILIGGMSLGGCSTTHFAGQSLRMERSSGQSNLPTEPVPTPGVVGSLPVNEGEGSKGGQPALSSTTTTTTTVTTLITASMLVPVNMKLCSQGYYVPATANPYLAGLTLGASLTYRLGPGDPPTPTDRVPRESPILVAPTNTACIASGASLYFSVHGGITYNYYQPPATADGVVDYVVSHQLTGINGISDIVAPIDALIGVFLSDGDPFKQVPPPRLDFSTQVARDYKSLSPSLGQVFFIGTGKTSSGDYHQVIVPKGATRLYFATMDDYQWNNNLGGLYGAIMVAQ